MRKETKLTQGLYDVEFLPQHLIVCYWNPALIPECISLNTDNFYSILFPMSSTLPLVIMRKQIQRIHLKIISLKDRSHVSKFSPIFNFKYRPVFLSMGDEPIQPVTIDTMLK